jgi:hypothetical protein
MFIWWKQSFYFVIHAHNIKYHENISHDDRLYACETHGNINFYQKESGGRNLWSKVIILNQEMSNNGLDFLPPKCENHETGI